MLKLCEEKSRGVDINIENTDIFNKTNLQNKISVESHEAMKIIENRNLQY